MVGTLLGAGSNPNAVTTAGITALMVASASGSADSVRLLLDRGASVNARESNGGQTALMFASAHNRPAVIELLIERGADHAAVTKLVDIPERSRSLRDSFRKRLEEVRKEREKAAAPAPEGERPEVSKRTESKPEEGRNLFAKLFGWIGPDKESKPAAAPQQRRRRDPYGALVGVQGGMTALLFAARGGNRDAVEVLLSKGADINQVADGSKTSPLLIATMNGHFDLANRLLELGADPNSASEPAGVTPLYAAINLAWAPRSGYPQPTAQQQQKLTHLDFMKALLDKGADPNVRLKKKVWFSSYLSDRSGIDESGATPFWRAAYGGDVPAMKLLRSYGADPNIPTMNPAERPPIENQPGREIIDVSGLPPVPVGGPAITPIHAAAGAGFGEGYAATDHRHHPAGFLAAVKYLVEECGADVNARDHEGNAPLHNAAARGDVELIEYLVSKGADVTVVNREGQTTADMANGPVQRVPPFPEALELLVRLGAVNNNKCVSC
jgi:ankyrin repeat protein